MLPPGWLCREPFACTKGGFRPYSYSTDTAENWMRWRLPQVLHEPKTSCLWRSERDSDPRLLNAELYSREPSN
jgi:hypothetical protein